MIEKLAIAIIFFCCACQAQAAVNCTVAGRFPDTDDTTCQNYYLCVLDSSTNTFISYNYTCPSTSLFNPTTQMCTTNYTCTASNSTSPANTTTSECTADGFIADSTSTDCTSYIQCVNINGTFDETTLTCPNSTFYNPDTTLCETNYTCSASPAATECTVAGRVLDTSDTTCQTYILCVLQTDGTFVQYTYTCPSTSVFNPTTQLCTTSYTCTLS